MKILPGYKTYLVALATLAYGGLGWYLGYLTFEQAAQLVSSGAAFATLRAAIAKGR